MKNTFVILTSCAITFSVSADCTFGDEVIPVNSSISVIEPIYERNARVHLQNEGLSETEIERRLKYMDGIVFNLECKRTYKANPHFKPDNAINIGEAFIYVGDVLVASDVYSEPLAKAKGLSSK
ncbi:hypothetical protein J4N45_10115 [Vibrio sp. SCSIO 43140]|uniref:hypothetical protein n=1 Tax=Vibrio sp. SCSIO 43140 TaxID=2819100 RepID=UPI002074FED5|nr:hypothetical protein [Vibrio sp. SCSIO 43140]USD58884.1 hypothetical protein J4N45_10115 [Vibrio sp. SCSIO 43140]